MRINVIKLGYIILFVTASFKSNSQTIWENQNSEVYSYLYRLSQKGLIDFQDIIRPISRNQIGNLLIELEGKSTQLSSVEKKELVFYLQEFRPIKVDDFGKIKFIKKDENKSKMKQQMLIVCVFGWCQHIWLKLDPNPEPEPELCGFLFGESAQ